MVTEEEYLKAKKIVEEYEDQEFQQGQLEAMYCTACQAIEAHDCFCSDELEYCPSCGQEEPYHDDNCVYHQQFN